VEGWDTDSPESIFTLSTVLSFPGGPLSTRLFLRHDATRKSKGFESCVGSPVPEGTALVPSWTTSTLCGVSPHRGDTAVATMDQRKGPDGKPVYRVRGGRKGIPTQ
jgi:hypothetical protein